MLRGSAYNLPYEHVCYSGIMNLVWAGYQTALSGLQVRELRQEVERLLLQKVERPELDLAHSPATSAMHNLLATDGF